MHRSSPIAVLAIAVSAVALAGCQSVISRFAQTGHLSIRPVPVSAPARDPSAGANEIYEHAAEAIDRREYGRALDLLQLARDGAPNDPRVLSALGVVYDKLGRFDLSKRYYDLAEAADPGSPVVARNRAYSKVLEARLQSARRPETLALEPGVQPEVRLAAAASVPSLAAASHLSMWAVRGGSSGGVRVVNASGRAGGGAALRDRLLARGWKARGGDDADGTPSRESVLRYPAIWPETARGLARSLRFPVRMEVCNDCREIELSIGADAVASATQANPKPGDRG